jgi:hypothetical protein
MWVQNFVNNETKETKFLWTSNFVKLSYLPSWGVGYTYVNLQSLSSRVQCTCDNKIISSNYK